MNKVVHFEIPADDLNRAKEFYGNTFGWTLQDWTLKDGSVYVGARTVEVDEQTYTPKEPGAINGGIVKRDNEVSTPIITIEVSSIEDFLEKAEQNGAKIITNRMPVEDSENGVMGYYAYLKDTENNMIGLWENIPQPG